MNTKRRLALATTLLFLILSEGICFAAGQRVIVLQSADIKPYREVVEGFRTTCSCEVIDVQLVGVDGAVKKGPPAAWKPEAIFAIGVDALKEANSSPDLPVISALTPCLEERESRRTGNATVQMLVSPDEQLRAIRDLFPERRRIGLIYDPGQLEPFVAEAKRSAASLGLVLMSRAATSAEEFPRSLDELAGMIDVFWLLPDTTHIRRETLDYLFLLSFERRVPVFAFSPKYLALGAIAATRIEPYDLGLQAGTYLAGKEAWDPSGKRCFFAKRWSLAFNEKVAARMGIDLGSGARAAQGSSGK
jgi:hypothetical protein